MKKRTVRREWKLVNPIELAMSRAAKLTQAEIDAQVNPLQESVDRLVKGQWTDLDWGAVRDAANRIEILMRAFKVENPDFLMEIGVVIHSANARFRANSTKALYAGEIESLQWLARSYANVLTQPTRGQFMDACSDVDRRVKEIVAVRRKEIKKEAATC